MSNRELAHILNELAIYYEFTGTPFKPQALERAADTISGLEESIADIFKHGGRDALDKLPHIGSGIADRIEEYLTTHRIKEYDRFKKKWPIDVEDLVAVEGVGSKTVLKLYEKLGIRTRKQLEKYARAGKLDDVPGLGKKTAEKILRSIGYQQQERGRLLLGDIEPIAHALETAVSALKGMRNVHATGSLRRMQETIGDLDLIATCDDPEDALRRFSKLPQLEHVYSSGEKTALVRLRRGLDADLTIVPEESLGAVLIAWTGDKAHNIHLRKIAIKQGLMLNDYGLFRHGKLVASRTEEDVYKHLGLDFVPPELRTDSGEIEAAAQHHLPSLIGYEDLKGDLQVQTNWTDGRASIAEMVHEARTAGLTYICITDHTKALAMTGGLDEKSIQRQWEEIDRVQAEVGRGFRILKGTECDILEDGSLDLPDEVLAQLEVVGASVHSHFNMSEKDQTARIMKVMENPHVDIIFHPTGRLIGQREPYKVDVEELLKAAKRTKTVMEVDADPHRLDLKDEYIRKAVDMGVKLAIDSDAHAAEHFEYLRYGIAQARRGWASAKDVINTRTAEQMLKLLK